MRVFLRQLMMKDLLICCGVRNSPDEKILAFISHLNDRRLWKNVLLRVHIITLRAVDKPIGAFCQMLFRWSVLLFLYHLGWTNSRLVTSQTWDLFPSSEIVPKYCSKYGWVAFMREKSKPKNWSIVVFAENFYYIHITLETIFELILTQSNSTQSLRQRFLVQNAARSSDAGGVWLWKRDKQLGIKDLQT